MTEQDQRAFEQWRADWRAALAQWMDYNEVDAVLYAAELSDIHLNDSIIPSFGRINPESSYAGVPTAIFPAGVNSHGNPVGFQLQGKAFQDADLLSMAYAFDQVAHGRVLPAITPALDHKLDAPDHVVEPLPALPQAHVQRPAFTLSDTARASLKEKGRAPAKVTLDVGCAGVGICSGSLLATHNGRRLKHQSLRVDDDTSVTLSLPHDLTAALEAGTSVEIEVLLTGKKLTVAPVDPVVMTVNP